MPLRPNRSGCEKGFGYSHPHWEADKGRASGRAARGGALATEPPRDTRITQEFIRNLSKNILFLNFSDFSLHRVHPAELEKSQVRPADLDFWKHKKMESKQSKFDD